MMKWLKLTLLLILLLLIAYLALFLKATRWAKPVPIDWTTYHNIDVNTKHYYGTEVFVPKNTDISKHWYYCPGFDLIPYFGGHCFNPFLWLKGGLDTPSGYMTYKGKVVAVFYDVSDPSQYPYHFHLHNNLCLSDGGVPRTDLTVWQCLSHLWFPMPVKKWMIHYWLIPNPEGVNEEYNPNLK